MSRYQEWMYSQTLEFIHEVCGEQGPGKKFKDRCFRAITLEELEELDNKYMNDDAEQSH